MAGKSHGNEDGQVAPVIENTFDINENVWMKATILGVECPRIDPNKPLPEKNCAYKLSLPLRNSEKTLSNVHENSMRHQKVVRQNSVWRIK